VISTEGTIGAKLVIGADGARSAVRSEAGLSAKTQSYGQTAIVARVRCERPHEDSCWQRFLAAGTLAFLPLADGATSIVWSVDEAEAKRLLALTPDEFSRELRLQSDDALGELTLEGERSAFPLQRLKARHATTPRPALPWWAMPRMSCTRLPARA
jgi:2-polyprenyl-6-methoxyphenol hydroxylase-like FAD-dependent oxidoreductase